MRTGTSALCNEREAPEPPAAGLPGLGRDGGVTGRRCAALRSEPCPGAALPSPAGAAPAAFPGDEAAGFSLRGGRGAGIGGPERLWVSRPWGGSRPGWMGPWAAGLRWQILPASLPKCRGGSSGVMEPLVNFSCIKFCDLYSWLRVAFACKGLGAGWAPFPLPSTLPSHQDGCPRWIPPRLL